MELEKALLGNWDMGAAVLRRGDFEQYFLELAKSDTKNVSVWKEKAEISARLCNEIWEKDIHDDVAFAKFILYLNPKEKQGLPEIPIDDLFVKRTDNYKYAKRILNYISSAGERYPYEKYWGFGDYKDAAYIQYMLLEAAKGRLLTECYSSVFEQYEKEAAAGDSLKPTQKQIDALKTIWQKVSSMEGYYFENRFFDSHVDFKKWLVEQISGCTLGMALCKLYNYANNPEWDSMLEKLPAERKKLQAMKRAFSEYLAIIERITNTSYQGNVEKQLQLCDQSMEDMLVFYRNDLINHCNKPDLDIAYWDLTLSCTRTEFILHCSPMEVQILRTVMKYNSEENVPQSVKAKIERDAKNLNWKKHPETQNLYEKLAELLKCINDCVAQSTSKDVFASVSNYEDIKQKMRWESDFLPSAEMAEQNYRDCLDAVWNGRWETLWEQKTDLQKSLCILLLSPINTSQKNVVLLLDKIRASHNWKSDDVFTIAALALFICEDDKCLKQDEVIGAWKTHKLHSELQWEYMDEVCNGI